MYNKILNHPLVTRYYVDNDPEYKASKMQKRNIWIVDNSDGLVAVWDGTPGGTANCVEYARNKSRETNKKIFYINPQDYNK